MQSAGHSLATAFKNGCEVPEDVGRASEACWIADGPRHFRFGLVLPLARQASMPTIVTPSLYSLRERIQRPKDFSQPIIGVDRDPSARVGRRIADSLALPVGGILSERPP